MNLSWGFHVLYIPDPLDDTRMMMKAWASGHGKAAINAVMIDCLSTGQCHPSKPASSPTTFGNGMRNFSDKIQP
ncbi:hypothetical protein LZ682_08805 [Klebsiella pneumoniae]|nr:hypothetical protein [Klebsiella pneumoniae]